MKVESALGTKSHPLRTNTTPKKSRAQLRVKMEFDGFASAKGERSKFRAELSYGQGWVILGFSAKREKAAKFREKTSGVDTCLAIQLLRGQKSPNPLFSGMKWSSSRTAE